MPQAPYLQVIHIRIRDELRRKLEREAKKHGFPLNNEIRIRLEDSFARGDARRTIDDAAMDMQICWERYSARFLRLDLEEQLAEAIVRSDDLTQIQTLARLWLQHRADEQRQPRGAR